MLLLKNSFIKIKNSFGRFLSLVFIIALGSAFFAGVKETSTDIIKSVDHYYDKYQLMDFKIISTRGLTVEDVDSIKALENVEKVEAGYSKETIIDGEAVKIYSLLPSINQVEIIEGRYPESEQEILVENGTYSIGERINLSEDDIKNKTFTVVGTVQSPMYIYENKGISTVGDGKLDTYMYILSDNFKMDYYTEVYLIAKDSLDSTSYLDNYNNSIAPLKQDLENLKPIRETARYEEILKEAMAKIYESKEKLNQEKQESEQEFQKANQKLLESKNKIVLGWTDYNNNKNKLANKKIEIEQTFSNNEKELQENEKKLQTTLKNYGLDRTSLDSKIKELERLKKELEQILEQLDKTNKEYEKYEQQLNTITTSMQSLQTLATSFTKIDEAKKELQKNKELWQTEYNKSKNALDDAYQQLLKAENDYSLGEKEYKENYNLYLQKIAEAEEEINDAIQEVEQLEKPVWYLMNREDNTGYTTLYDSATKIDSIAAVFPLFFILVAFLMCMNTMTRMIEEERGEIGLLASLGYSRSKIICEYIIYVCFSTLIGLILGLTIGYLVIPIIIYRVYISMFILPDLIVYFNTPVAIGISLSCLGIMSLVTFYTVNHNFRQMPANLLRPEAPKMGKKVLLERIPILWKKFSFTWKVTIRNLFRYKKRIIMTLIGISGCTALLLTGFGIKDSIGSLITKQFGEIEAYDAMLFLKDKISSPDSKISTALEQNKIDQYAYLNMENYKFQAHNNSIDIYLMAFADNTNLDQFIHLRDNENKLIELSDSGVVLSSKTAKMLGIEVGDTFTIRNSKNELIILKLSAISNNYVNHYIYMNETYYKQVFGSMNYNTVIVNLPEEENIGNIILDLGYFNNIQYLTDNMNMFQDVIRSMNDIVLLIIGFSCFLAITVLYNLTTINISERQREIATLKVLGFHNQEVSTYVYRETLILTILGMSLGMFLGVLLNQFVMTVAETDEILFVKQINLPSYFYTFIIMTLFTLVVQGITYFILKRINMIDSLKSVE